MDKLKVLTFTSLYPNAAQSRHGIFTEHRLHSLLATGEVEARVVAPVPWVPGFLRESAQFGVYDRVPGSDRRGGIDILYPRYPTLPKIGMTLAPFLLATAMLRPLRMLIRGGFDFDVLDAFYLYPDGVAAALLGLILGKPVVVTAFGTDVNVLPDYTLPRAMIRWAARRASAVTTVSQALKDKLVSLGVPQTKVHVIRHGVDFRLFAPPADRAALRGRLGMSRPVLLCVGHLIELKGQHVAIEAMSDLPDMELWVIGHGEMDSRLRALAAELGLADRVKFLGHVDQSDLPAYYGAADALILASSREGIPNVILESMACGTPVVATRVGGVPEVLTAPEAGLLIPKRSAEALARTVRALFRDYPDRAATRRYVERFSWTDTAAQHLAVLQEVKSRDSGHLLRPARGK